ncbi:hypothetical protein Ahy_B05g073993 [Arachis hypogaea]|uniref:Uncharacterized protein n=1 Tax=Arachis hypogaea TaxID=3818 RepID=A0A444YXN8_ARAHY|nr:hypothetical protein Ahy_B05g073993 [Arachis hypogaea]
MHGKRAKHDMRKKGMHSSASSMDSQTLLTGSHNGVRCDNITGLVVGLNLSTLLNLPYMELSGEISPSLLELESLMSLDLSLNYFLDLRSNFLQGEVHEMLSRIQNLQSLVLQGNQLSGELPDSLGKLEHLEVLDLSNNTITGPTPASLANLSSLRTLNLGHNRLNGTKTSIGDVEAIFIC